MKRIIMLITVFASLTAASTYAQSADDIVNKYIEAIGGKDNLKKLKTIKRAGNLEVQPGMSAPVTLQLIDGKSMRFDLTIQGMTMIQVIDGNSGWMVMPFQGVTTPEPIPEDQVKEMKGEMDITGELFNYKDKGFTLALDGMEKVNEKDTYKLKLTSKDGKVNYYYIDKDTFFPVKEMQIVKAEEKDVEISKYYSDFRKSDSGLVFAYKLKSDNGGGDITWESIEVNPKIDPSIFKMPTK